MAVPENIFSRFFSYPFIQKSINCNQVLLLVYGTLRPRITQWIN
ncbi:MAG: hypothetical protein F6K19_49465 [Cyanothece sp. SIO1E1]|nr:hypothetical protein [Cyanothece sp. SIO1E1]